MSGEKIMIPVLLPALAQLVREYAPVCVTCKASIGEDVLECCCTTVCRECLKTCGWCESAHCPSVSCNRYATYPCGHCSKTMCNVSWVGCSVSWGVGCGATCNLCSTTVCRKCYKQCSQCQSNLCCDCCERRDSIVFGRNAIYCKDGCLLSQGY